MLKRTAVTRRAHRVRTAALCCLAASFAAPAADERPGHRDLLPTPQTPVGWRGAYSSVTRAGACLFIGFERGVLLAFRPGKTHEEVGRLSLGALRSTPVFRGRRLYLRALGHLYCIEGPEWPGAAPEAGTP